MFLKKGIIIIIHFCDYRPIVKAKALDLHKKLCDARGMTETKFTASDGWLWRFCQRHCVRQLSLQGERLSADKPAADQFIVDFQEFVRIKGYTNDQIFNADESGLYFKLLPQKSLAAHFEKTADGRKTQKERVTISACSNASGSIKLPLLLIGKSKNPRCFKHVKKEDLPLIYTNQSNAWVTATIFAEWFHKNFVPAVKRRLIELQQEPKAILLIDNCSAHPDEQELTSSDGTIITKFLPPNVTSLIQPMDQGVLQAIKSRYRRKILEELVLREDNDECSIIDFLKGINLLKVSFMISSCWNDISPNTLHLSWHKILSNSDLNPVEQDPNENVNTCTDDLSLE